MVRGGFKWIDLASKMNCLVTLQSLPHPVGMSLEGDQAMFTRCPFGLDVTVGVKKSSMQKLAGAIDDLIGRVGLPVTAKTGDCFLLSEKRPSIFLKRTVTKDGGGVNQLAGQNRSPNVGE